MVSQELITKLKTILKETEPNLSDKQLNQVVSDCISLVPIFAEIVKHKKGKA